MPLKYNLGSDCGSVGRAVSFDTRDLQFESSDRQILFTINSIKIYSKKKKGRELPINRKNISFKMIAYWPSQAK